jgi:glucosylceramidase
MDADTVRAAVASHWGQVSRAHGWARTRRGGAAALGLLALFLVVVPLLSTPRATAANEAVAVWLTTGDKGKLLEPQPSATFGSGGASGLVVDVNEHHRYQELDGFGAAMTDSSAWLIANELTAAQRDELMRRLFSPDGIGMSYVRVPIGSSDHALSHYTYDDTCCDLSDFSLAHDAAYVIPVLQQAKALNPNLKLMGSAWSGPAWMKSPARLNGGRLNAEYADEYAAYLARFVSGYAQQGLPISAVAMQNEPQSVPHDYPGMWMTPADQAALASQHLGPALAGTGTKILALDHNWALAHYAVDVLDDPAARQYVAGTAFHCYGGTPDQQLITRNAHPDKEILFTECASGGWATDWADNLVWDGVNLLVGATRNWARTALKWNIALDRDGGPHTGGCTNCAGIVTIDRAGGGVTYNHDYYSIGHASKFVRPGAQRIASSTHPQAGLHTVAFRNPDGSKALVAVNANESALSFTVRWGGQSFPYTLPRESIATFTWNGAQASPAVPGAPAAPSATASDGRVSLTWEFSALADSYTIRRAEAAGGPYTTLATGVVLPEYVDASVVNGTAYRYVVSAANGHGESAASAPVVATPNPPRLRSAAATIEGESFDDQSGVAVQGCSDGSGCGQSIGYTDDGDYVAWNRVHFGDGAQNVSVRVASHSSGGTLELRLDSPDGPLAGTVQIGGTGGWDNWTTLTAPITGASGIHSLYLVFRGDPPETAVSGIANLNWLRFTAPGAPPDPGGPLPRTGWAVTASPTSGSEGNAIDGNPASRWTSGTGQADGHWFRVDLGAPRTFDKVVVDSGTGNDYARGYRVDASSDGAAWTALASGSGTGQLLTVPLPATTARYLRLVQTGSAGNWWSIHELDVFAPIGPTAPDLVRPETTIDAGPTGKTNQGSATFEFSSSEPGSTFACSLDGASFVGCTSPHHVLGLGEGEHRFEVRATDAAGNVDDSPASRTWTIAGVVADCGAPRTVTAVADAWFDQASTSDNKGSDSVLKVMSKGPVNNLRAAVRFANPAAPSGCAVASATLRLYAGSARSDRTISVQRLAGGWTESGITWGNQPSTTGPAATTTAGTGYRQWDVTAQVRAMYESGLNNGFLVRDAVENADAEQQFYSREKGESPPQLVITFAAPSGGGDTTAPETAIGPKPPALTRTTSATFGFSADEPGATFQCSLDGAAYSPCTSPLDLVGLTARVHTFGVRAVDAAGNADETPATHTWTVDDVAPETTITSASSSSVSFAGSDQPVPGAALTFTCSLDAAAFAPCTSPVAIGGLSVGQHELAVRATDPAGNTDGTPARHVWTVAAPLPQLPTSQAPQGTWFPSYGAGGYALGAWNGTNSTNDLVGLPAGVSLVVEQAARTRWSSSTTNVRALQGPAGSGRRAAAWSHSGQVRLRLDFASAWSGELHLYALDWDNRGRRQTISVDDGSGPQLAALDASFANGLWAHAPVTVPAGGSVRITVSRSAGTSAVLSGLFLGGATPLLPTSQAPQGTWFPSYGAGGYALGAWNGTSGTSDVVALPAGATLVVEQAGRTRWSSSTTNVRALQGPGGSARRAAAWTHSTEVRLRLDFAIPWSGNLHLYALDWDNQSRRQTITVDDGSGPRLAILDSGFANGVWARAAITVPAGGSVRIAVSRTAGTNAVLSGVLLGGP